MPGSIPGRSTFTILCQNFPSPKIGYCSCRGSNPGPSAHKTEALPTAPQERCRDKKCLGRGLNPRPRGYESRALTNCATRASGVLVPNRDHRLGSSPDRPSPTHRLLAGIEPQPKRGAGRIELPTSPTRTENHATRPCTHCLQKQSDTRARDRTGDLLRVRQSS